MLYCWVNLHGSNVIQKCSYSVWPVWHLLLPIIVFSSTQLSMLIKLSFYMPSHLVTSILLYSTSELKSTVSLSRSLAWSWLEGAMGGSFGLRPCTGFLGWFFFRTLSSVSFVHSCLHLSTACSCSSNDQLPLHLNCHLFSFLFFWVNFLCSLPSSSSHLTLSLSASFSWKASQVNIWPFPPGNKMVWSAAFLVSFAWRDLI